ncbi:YopX family protein [Brevibacillus borstelensis]|uniref:YopX family protein n=1 Tax=Brevibacillus borstelensis TaxID=45462 RepID=UPI0030C0A464
MNGICVADANWTDLDVHSDIVVMQFTGLCDKNGKKIYEGDLVEIRGHAFEGSIEIDGVYEVGYNETMELCCGSWLLHRELPYITVIGNKYENPELMRAS